MVMEMKGPQSNSGPDVPLGLAALVIGTVMLLAYFASRLGIFAETPSSVFPIGIALFVSGYIACFALRRVHRRIRQLEDRITAIAKDDREKKLSDGRGSSST